MGNTKNSCLAITRITNSRCGLKKLRLNQRNTESDAMDSGLDMFLFKGVKSKVKGISVLYFVMISLRDYYVSSLDRALEQRHNDLALKQYKDDEGGHQNQDRAGA
jgi:hypothetical protein